MKNKLYSIIILLAAVFFVACDNVNSLHDKYLQNGENLYVGKVDSFHIYGGQNRAKFVVWVGDYRSVNIIVTRMDTSLTYNFMLSETNRVDSMVFYIDNLKEGTNVLNWNAFSADGKIKSIPQGTSVTAWGDRFESFLTNRKIVSLTYSAILKRYRINWDANNVKEPTFSTYAIGHEVNYITKSLNDTIVQTMYPAATLSTPGTITDDIKNLLEFTGQIRYRMLYKPSASCIDTFRTEYSTYTLPMP